jgi:hypothetical protein
MSDREDLSVIIHKACGCDGTCPPEYEDGRIADAILAAGWRAPDAEQFVIGHQVGKTWYRSLTPDGKVWCESSDREDFIDDEGLDTGPDGAPLTFQKLTHYSATSGWQEWAP